MNPVIVQAIREQRILSINYPPGPRTVEPHAHGASADGNDLLRAFQTDGASESGEHVNWKLFRTDRMEGMTIQDERFDGPRPGYRRDDKAMKGGIYAQL